MHLVCMICTVMSVSGVKIGMGISQRGYPFLKAQLSKIVVWYVVELLTAMGHARRIVLSRRVIIRIEFLGFAWRTHHKGIKTPGSKFCIESRK